MHLRHQLEFDIQRCCVHRPWRTSRSALLLLPLNHDIGLMDQQLNSILLTGRFRTKPHSRPPIVWRQRRHGSMRQGRLCLVPLVSLHFGHAETTPLSIPM